MNVLLRVLCVGLLVAGISLTAQTVEAQWGCGHGGYHGAYGGHGGFVGHGAFYGPGYGHFHGGRTAFYAPVRVRPYGFGHTPYFTGYRGYPYGNPYRPFGGLRW